ncbi:hypothetical protein OBBRIDRAFT_798936 [Obba rivulosa]|uniref:F-box domain-containing protein n=1 Tax=Obba rivulosa TaxID=1052685 RepID=A0A8E2AI55_9APHY|nr:hypothetical protein OBBRIDRAFT_798936 [Obba rivulosa]
MTISQSRTFPAELFDNVIDFLHDDRDALKNCSLTCHSWLPSAGYHIFGTIRLVGYSYPNDLPRLGNFLQLLRANSRLGLFVRSLDVHLDETEDANLFTEIVAYLGAVQEFYLYMHRWDLIAEPGVLAQIGPVSMLRFINS